MALLRTVTPPSARTSHSGLEVRQLRAFLALVESGRVTAAARTLALAQSTVSEALAALERALGAQLVVRGRGSNVARLTAAGQALVPCARDILAAIDTAHAAVAGATKSARASVEIIANESASTYVLPAALAELRQRWPKTRFSVSVATCSSVREGVADGGFDVGLMLEWGGDHRGTGESAHAESEDRRTLVDGVPLVIFARPSHPLVGLASRRRVPRAELAEYRLFVSDAAGDFHAMVHRFFTHDRPGGSRIESTGSVEGVKRAVIANADAVGLLPAYAVADELRLGTLARLDVRPPPPQMQLVARLSRSRVRHPAADELLEAVRRAGDVHAMRKIS